MSFDESAPVALYLEHNAGLAVVHSKYHIAASAAPAEADLVPEQLAAREAVS